MATTRAVISDEELARLLPEGKSEFIDGEVRVSPAGGRHGALIVELTRRLANYVKEQRLGHVFDSSTGYHLPGRRQGDELRAPDLSFIARGRFAGEKPPKGFITDVAPDLAVEVLSPSDRLPVVIDKVAEYLRAGVRLVWTIDPERGKARVYRSGDAEERVLEGAAATLDGEDVVPGFRCPLSELLD